MGRFRFLLLLALLLSGCAAPDPSGEEFFPPFYGDAHPFLTAIQNTRASPLPQKITGITVPHHLLAADLIAEAFTRAAKQDYRRIIILSPDHFDRSRTPAAVAVRGFQTVLGSLAADGDAVRRLLGNNLVSPSHLFSHEHGVQALLPFAAHYFPRAKIVALALKASAGPKEWDSLARTLAPLLTPDTLLLQSTDFSHYLPRAAARKRDQETLRLLSGGNPQEVVDLREPDHLDSRAAQYLQLRLQNQVYQSRPLVTGNRNSQDYTRERLEKTTSYIVQLYSPEHLAIPGLKRTFFGGDTFCGRHLAKKLARKDWQDALVARVLKITGGASLIVNLEGVVMPQAREDTGPYALSMTASLTLPLLKRLNVQAVSLANNHTNDFGPGSYRRMKRLLREVGILTLDNLAIHDFRNFRLAALTDLDNDNLQKSALLRKEDLRGLLEAPRDKPLFAFIHWGQEYAQDPGPREEVLIAALESRGVELIIGGHSHRAGNLLCRDRTCVAFSLGNFIFDQNRPEVSGALLEVIFFPQGTYFLRWHPLGNLYLQ